MSPPESPTKLDEAVRAYAAAGHSFNHLLDYVLRYGIVLTLPNSCLVLASVARNEDPLDPNSPETEPWTYIWYAAGNSLPATAAALAPLLTTTRVGWHRRFCGRLKIYEVSTLTLRTVGAGR